MTPRARFAHSCGGRGAILLGLWRLRLGVDARGESQAAARVDLRGRVAALVRFARVLELSKPALVLAFRRTSALVRGVDPAVLGARVPAPGERSGELLALRGFARFGHRGRGGNLERARVFGETRRRVRELAAEHSGLVVHPRGRRRVVQHPTRFLRDGRLQAIDLGGGRFLGLALRHERREGVRVLQRGSRFGGEIPASLVQQRREVRVAVDAEVVERIAVVEGGRGG